MGKINSPNQVALVTSRGKGKDNIIALTWHTRTSFQPYLFLISVDKRRFSYGLIKESGCFVVNFMPYELGEKIVYCGNHSGRDVDKFKETGLGREDAEDVNCCRIKEALAYLECEVVNEVETGDHVIFVGKVLKSGFKKDGKRPFQLVSNEFTTTVD